MTVIKMRNGLIKPFLIFCSHHLIAKRKDKNASFLMERGIQNDLVTDEQGYALNVCRMWEHIDWCHFDECITEFCQ